MSEILPTNCSKLILPDLDLIATETSLVIRKPPKFSNDGFLQSLLSSVVTGQASIRSIISSSRKQNRPILESLRCLISAPTTLGHSLVQGT